MSIKAVDLNFVYGAGTAFEQKALKHVNFEIQDGEFVGLIGHTRVREVHADSALKRAGAGDPAARFCTMGKIFTRKDMI